MRVRRIYFTPPLKMPRHLWRGLLGGKTLSLILLLTGIGGYFQKPFSQEILARKVRKILDRKQYIFISVPTIELLQYFLIALPILLNQN